jgi:hypothetical protein
MRHRLQLSSSIIDFESTATLQSPQAGIVFRSLQAQFVTVGFTGCNCLPPISISTFHFGVPLCVIQLLSLNLAKQDSTINHLTEYVYS